MDSAAQSVTKISSPHVNRIMKFHGRRNSPAYLMFVCRLLIVSQPVSGREPPCSQSEYELPDRCCPMCPPGTRVSSDCRGSRTTSCSPCTEGTFMNHQTYRRLCYTCANCGEGLRVKRSCTATSDTVCEPQEGFYCVESTEENCGLAQKHKSCGPGQFIRHRGTVSSDSVCSDCTEGTFSDGTFQVCRPHTHCSETQLKVKEGSSSEDVVCRNASRSHHTLIFPFCFFIFTLLGLFANKVWTLNKHQPTDKMTVRL